MMYKVYRMDTVPSQTNAYTTGRMDTWTLKLDMEFADRNEAEQYVINKNLQTTILSSLIIDMKIEDKNNFIKKFCFGDEHLDLCRYFLGKPDSSKILQCLKDKGINVLK